MKYNKRFYYRQSHVYGWCVYDSERNHTPAYDACCDLLEPIKSDESGTTYESPTLLENEYAAMKLCRRLNVAWSKEQQK